MMWKRCRRSALAVVCGAVCFAASADIAVAAGDVPASLPKFDNVKKVVLKYFGTIPGHEAGDLLSKSQVAPVFPQIDRLGWRVAQQKAILADVLPDSDLLVRELSTPAGKKFARQLAGVPEGYDRLDRLARMPRGHQNLRTLIKGPDGYLMIKYMTTSKYGKNLGTMLSQTPGGKGFDESTGRIYTVEMLLDRLEAAYKEAVKTVSKQKGVEPLRVKAGGKQPL